jgi:salicylate hydroxylase
MSVDVLVIGAGLGGLAAAIAAAQAGCSVRVLEQSRGLKEVGAGLTLGPNAVHALDDLGLADEVRALGDEPEASGVRDALTGEKLVTVPRKTVSLERYGAPYLVVHRADLQQLLADRLDRLAPGAVQFGARVDTAAIGSDGAVAGGHDAKLLIGADGVHSAIRRSIFGDPVGRFSGYVAWRAAFSSAGLPAGVIDHEAALHITTGRTGIRYLIRKGQMVNLALFAETSGWEEEGWSIPASRAEVLERFGDFCAPMRTLMEAAPESAWFKWALIARDPLPAIAQGRAALLGDAAHPMLPFLGQGAAMALEDAVALGMMLRQHGPVPEALQAYESMRLARVSLVQRESATAVQRYHTTPVSAYTAPQHKGSDALDLYRRDPAFNSIETG